MCHILIADDEIQSTRLLFNTLFSSRVKAGEWRLSYAQDGHDAMLALQEEPDIEVVVTDLAMPGSDGFGVMDFVQRHFPLIPVIVCSGYGDMPNIRKAMNLGAFDFLIKPFTGQDFESTITLALTKSTTDTSTLKRLQLAIAMDYAAQRHISDLYIRGAHVQSVRQ